MAIPIALTEGAGDKMLPLVYDNAGSNAPAAWRAIVPRTINASPLAHVGVATHGNGATIASDDPVVLIAGADGTTARRFAVDSGGRLIMRPSGGAYDAGGGVNGFGHPRLIARATQNSEEVGWEGIATHQDGATWVTPGGIVVLGGHDPVANTVKKAIVDPAGRQRTHEDYVLGGQGHLNVTAGTAVALRAASTPFRKVRVVADHDNAVTVFLGLAGVTADEAAATGGYQLRPNVPVEWSGAGNLNAVMINGTSAAAGVSFLWWT